MEVARVLPGTSVSGDEVISASSLLMHVKQNGVLDDGFYNIVVQQNTFWYKHARTWSHTNNLKYHM